MQKIKNKAKLKFLPLAQSCFPVSLCFRIMSCMFFFKCDAFQIHEIQRGRTSYHSSYINTLHSDTTAQTQLVTVS